MKCPFCKSDQVQVLESRSIEDGSGIRRRRECEKCKNRFTTVEKIKGNALWVIKKDGNREPFDREKLRRGVLRSIEKRPVSLEVAEELVDQIEREMLRKQKEEVTSCAIGKAVLRRLKRVDKVAWLRFASVYLNFEDLKDFEKAIDKLS